MFTSPLMLAGCGADGQNGKDGKDGKDGKNGTMWYSGTENIETISGGNAGDFYFDTDDYILYQKSQVGTWTVVTQNFGKPGENGLQGEKGDDGQQGEKGEQGIQGEKGDKGEDGESNYVWIRFADKKPTSNLDIKETAGNWMGIYNGTSSTAPTDYLAYTWIKVGGQIEERSVLVSNPLQVSDFANKKITILGDSVTVGIGSTGDNTGYAKRLGDILGCEIENKGQNGTVFVTGAKQASGADAVSRINDVTAYSGVTDYFIVALGANDWTLSNYGDKIQLGELGSSDTSTIYGAVNYYAKTLKQKFEGTDTKIYFSTPTVSATVGGTSPSSKNDLGYTLRDICNAIIETCETYDIPTFDMNLLSGITQSNFQTNMKDGVHPNDNGHQLMANALSNFLLENYSFVSADNAVTLTLKNGTEITKMSFEKGCSWQVVAKSVSGKIFVCYKGTDGNSYYEGDSITLTSNLTLNAIYQDAEIQDIKINIENFYGGIKDNLNDKIVSVKPGVITAETLALEDSLGLVPTYYKNADLTEEFNFEEALTEQTTIYVDWTTTSDWFTFSGSDINGFSTEYTSLTSAQRDSITRLVIPNTDADGNNVTRLSGQGGAMKLFMNQNPLKNLQTLVIKEGITTVLGTFSLSYHDAVLVNTFASQATIYLPSTLKSLDITTFMNINAEKFVIATGNSYYETDVTGALIFSKQEGTRTLVKSLNGAISNTSIVLDETVNAIADRAFGDNRNVISITINGTLAASPSLNAFNNCEKLKTINFGGDVTNINRTMFTNITGLDHIYVKNEEQLQMLTNILKYGSITYEEGATEIADNISTLATKISVFAE